MLREEIIANKGYAIFSVSDDDRIDEIAVKVLRQDCPEFLLPFKTISIDGDMEFRYEMTDGVRLRYQINKMSRKEFVQQMISMLLPFKNCGDWLLDYHFLYLDPQYIFVNAKDQAIHYIYLPVKSGETSDRKIRDFFINYVLSIELQDDKDFMLRILRQLRDEDVNLLTILETLQNEIGNSKASVKTPEGAFYSEQQKKAEPVKAPVYEEKKPEKKASSVSPVIETPKAGAFGGFGKTSVKPEKKEAPKQDFAAASGAKFGEMTLEEELLKKLSGGGSDSKADKKKNKEKAAPTEKSSKKGFFDGFLGKKKEKGTTPVQQEPSGFRADPARNTSARKEEQAPVFDQFRGSEIMSDDTEMADYESYVDDGSVVRLQLMESGGYSAPANIELDLGKGFVTVGRYDKTGYPCADYNFDHSMTFISRNHFRIERIGNSWKIIDISKNGTMLNGREMIKNMSYDLNRGDVITISKNVRLTYRVL